MSAMRKAALNIYYGNRVSVVVMDGKAVHMAKGDSLSSIQIIMKGA